MIDRGSIKRRGSFQVRSYRSEGAGAVAVLDHVPTSHEQRRTSKLFNAPALEMLRACAAVANTESSRLPQIAVYVRTSAAHGSKQLSINTSPNSTSASATQQSITERIINMLRSILPLLCLSICVATALPINHFPHHQLLQVPNLRPMFPSISRSPSNYLDARPNSVRVTFTAENENGVKHVWLPMGRRIYTRTMPHSCFSPGVFG